MIVSSVAAVNCQRVGGQICRCGAGDSALRAGAGHGLGARGSVAHAAGVVDDQGLGAGFAAAVAEGEGHVGAGVAAVRLEHDAGAALGAMQADVAVERLL